MNPQNKPHPHAELIHAWADGKTIQTRLKESQEKWKDFLGSNLPLFNDKHFEYRIKPSNEPWKPKEGERYFYLDIVDGEISVDDYPWRGDAIDNALYRLRNIFPTKEEAEAAIPRAEAALKSAFATDTNVGSKSEIDGEPLSDGEKELIKALRHAGRITGVYDYRTTVLVSANDNASGVYTHRQHIAFFTSSSDTGDELIIDALKQIKAEQEASNE